ncbi:hypothetical protein pdam_00025118, partial [Pocillopora damicornis]
CPSIFLHSEQSMDVMDSTWHHVCVSWDGRVGLLAVFKDGHINFKLNDFMGPLLQKPNEGAMGEGPSGRNGEFSLDEYEQCPSIFLHSEQSMDVMDSTWHHVCVSWDGRVGLLAVFKDGHINFKLNDFMGPLLQKPNEGIVTIGFRNINETASTVLGKLSGFNIWSTLVTTEEILRMSYGCGTEAGNAMAWGKVRNGLIGEVEMKSLPTCNDGKRARLVVDTVDLEPNGTAVLVSQTYNRSSDGKSRCLRFRYMLRGSGDKTLTIFQKTGIYREIPIWTWKGNSGRDWIYGEVPLTSTTKTTEDKGGSWSAASNNRNQWLEIDLVSQNINVTRIATQGRHDSSQWVTKYKLQYSKDGVNFQYYKEPMETAHKIFDGNVEQHAVVYNELVPPIKARFIRFRPVDWYGHISMRVELYGCQDDRPCDTSVDWCGWKNERGWKSIKHKDLDQVYQNEGGGGKGFSDNNNFEVLLPDSEYGYISLSDVILDQCCFTICFWLKTASSGFYTEYNNAGSAKENKTLVFGIYCGNNTFSLQSGSERSEQSMDVMDSTWHHVCVSWDGRVGLLAVFKDGHINFKFNDFMGPLLQKPNEGIVTIGFRNINGTASTVLGKLSGFNIWSTLVTTEEILRMSYGCGTEAGNAMAWGKVRNGLIGEVEMKSRPTCNDGKRARLVVDTVDLEPNGTAVLVSQTYNRSSDGKSRCLRFRYMLQGSGDKTLTISQKTGIYREIPIWTWKGNSGRDWIYGEVPLTSTTKFKILIKAQKSREKDLIALTGIYVKEGLDCKLRPLSAKQDHPTCKGCDLQIFDGSETSAPAIGRFCGYMYPPIVISSSNNLRIVLRCAANPYTARFKILYNSTAAHKSLESSCSLQQECPARCKCEEFGGQEDKKILVTGEDLLNVPNHLPTNVGAVYVIFGVLFIFNGLFVLSSFLSEQRAASSFLLFH